MSTEAKQAAMQVACCLTPGDIRLETRARPRPGRGEAILRIRRIGVCGTDIHAYGGRQPYFDYPRVLGHELAGEIVEVGAEVASELIGQQAYVIPYLHCGTCRACRRGRTNCCQRMEVVGVHRDGGMAEYLCVPTGHLVTSDSLSLDALALIECQAIGAHAVRRAAIEPGELAVVVGAGPIGMGVAQLARASGADVVVVDAAPARLAFCRDVLGFENTLDPTQGDLPGRIAALNDGALADAVFDATGNPQAMEAGFALVGHAGRYTLVGVVKADIRFADPDFHARELTLLASRNATCEDFERVATLLAANEIQSLALITHRAELADVPDRMPDWCNPASGVVKAMIHLDDKPSH